MRTTRREFVGLLAGSATAAACRPGPGKRPSRLAAATAPPAGEAWRAHFPALGQMVNGHLLVYLDSAATTQRPAAVIDAVASFYRRDNANPSGQLHTLARRANDEYEDARRVVAELIRAADPLEIVFTRGTTEAINLVATAWGGASLRPGDEIVLTIAEHASNLLPWQLAAERAGAQIRIVDIDDDGRPRLERLDALLSDRTRLVAFSHVSNVLGAIVPAAEICRRARAAGARVLIDAAQSVPHIPVSVAELDCDFLAFSGHKLLGPMGIGVLWARRELLDRMPPYQAGSNMAHDVGLDSRTLSEGARRFGAGTPNVADAIGLREAIRFLRTIGPEALQAHERAITRRMLDRLGAIPAVRLLGSAEADGRVGVFSFTAARRMPRDVALALDRRGIAIRAGDLAALPLLERFGTRAAARASCHLYTSLADVDAFGDALEEVVG